MLCPHCGKPIREAATANDALVEPLPERDIRKIEKDDEFIENLARFADGTLSEAAVKLKYRLSDEDWAALGEDDKLVERIEAAKLRRIRTGTTKRERAQIEVADAPPILGNILRDTSASARHRVDAAKALDAFAGNGPEATPAAERFSIVINLSADEKIRIDKPIRPGPDDGEVIDQELLPMIAAKNREDNDGGEPL